MPTIIEKEDEIKLSNNAAEKIYELISAEDSNDLKLRVYIVGGGCSGFQYGFAFDKKTADDDTIISKVPKNNDTQAVNIVIDAMSLQYLKGSEIDYIENLRGSHFTVNNPNANTTCGCGSSFSI